MDVVTCLWSCQRIFASCTLLESWLALIFIMVVVPSRSSIISPLWLACVHLFILFYMKLAPSTILWVVVEVTNQNWFTPHWFYWYWYCTGILCLLPNDLSLQIVKYSRYLVTATTFACLIAKYSRYLVTATTFACLIVKYSRYLGTGMLSVLAYG